MKSVWISRKCGQLAIVVLAIVAIGPAKVSATLFHYYVTDLGDLPGGNDESIGYDINNFGQVVGSSVGGDWDNAFLWTPDSPNGTTGTLIDVGDFAGGLNQATAYAINSRGQVVGYSNDETGGRAFLWSPDTPNGTIGAMVNLGALTATSASVALDINDRGQVTGYSFNPPPTRAFIWNPTTPNGSAGNMTDLSAMLGGSISSEGSAINNFGQVAGHYNTGSNTDAYLWTPAMPNGTTGSVVNLSGSLPSGSSGHFAFVDAMNNSGALAGYTAGGSGRKAVGWFPSTPNSSMGSATIFPGFLPEAVGINDAGDVVGFSNSLAYIWPIEGGSIDLNTLIDLPSGQGWVLKAAAGINDLGQITGYGTHNGKMRAFLLTPVPEPSAIVLAMFLFPAIGGAMGRRARAFIRLCVPLRFDQRWYR